MAKKALNSSIICNLNSPITGEAALLLSAEYFHRLTLKYAKQQMLDQTLTLFHFFFDYVSPALQSYFSYFDKLLLAFFRGFKSRLTALISKVKNGL